MSKYIDITGAKYNRLTVVKLASLKGSDGPEWECLCDCGNTKIISGHNLKRGHTKSCGCLFKEIRKTAFITHGRTKTPEYRSWNAMKQRCTNPKHSAYIYYGGRGITVCPEWLNSFEQFLFDMGEKPNQKMSIERIDVNEGYYKDNCKWATAHTQTRNTTRNLNITINGITKCAADWAKQSGISQDAITNRYRRGIRDAQLISVDLIRKNNVLITYRGKTQSLKRWAEELDVNYKRLHMLVRTKQLPFEVAITM